MMKSRRPKQINMRFVIFILDNFKLYHESFAVQFNKSFMKLYGRQDMKFGFILDNKFASEIHYKRKIKDLSGNGQSNSGVIYNDSDFDIKYYITSHVSQIVLTNETNEVNPELELDLFGGAKIRGWRKITNTFESCFQNVQTYEVLAGRLNTTGLSNLQLNTSFITIKAVIGKYEKLLFGNCPIKSVNDIRYKIRKDLSYRQLDDKQAQNYIKMATKMTTADDQNSIKVAPERQERRKKYLEELQKKYATQVSNSQVKTSSQKMKRSSP